MFVYWNIPDKNPQRIAELIMPERKKKKTEEMQKNRVCMTLVI